MKLLIIGGTGFLGRHIVDAARFKKHQVTLFNRGKTDPKLFPGVRRLLGDRERDLDLLGDSRWDAVIDTCGFLPQFVAASASFLRKRADHYTYISSVCVYRDWNIPDKDEASAVKDPPGAPLSAVTPETYGPLKGACEHAVREIFRDRALIVRPGTIVGPFDPTDQFAYWAVRIGRGGKVLAPGDPGRLVQVIDVRDLAKWIVGMAASKSGGTFNACGPSVPFRQVLETCREETGGESEFTWVDSAFLLKENVAPYELPLWDPYCDDTFKVDAALKRGLVSRPLRETIRDTMAWYRSGAPRWPLRSGLESEREARLLDGWRRKRAAKSVAASRSGTRRIRRPPSSRP